jgi:succinate dehydrogenase/fumarate reductase-like Fe-S protein
MQKYKKKKEKVKKKKKCIMDYCCNPRCIWVWGNNDFPTPFRKK